MFNFFFALMKLAYRLKLRGLLKESIDDPNSENDEKILGIIDRIFDYNE